MSSIFFTTPPRVRLFAACARASGDDDDYNAIAIEREISSIIESAPESARRSGPTAVSFLVVTMVSCPPGGSRTERAEKAASLPREKFSEKEPSSRVRSAIEVMTHPSTHGNRIDDDAKRSFADVVNAQLRIERLVE